MKVFNGRGAAMDAAKKRVKRDERRVAVFKGPNDDHIHRRHVRHRGRALSWRARAVERGRQDRSGRVAPMTLHVRIAEALGWSARDVRSLPLQSLRELVRPTHPNLAELISRELQSGRIVRSPDHG